jgi:hypothetical protein
MSETEARQLLGVRLVLLLACGDGRGLEELRSFATKEARAIRDQLTAETSVVRLSVRKAAAVVSGSETGVDRSDVDAAIDVTSEGDSPMDLIAAAKGLAERSEGVVDPRRSVAVAGREFLVRPGGGAVQIHFCLRRLPSLTTEEFRALWAGEFAAQARLVPHVTGYRQIEVDGAWAAAASDATGLEIVDVDGVAVEWFADDDEFAQAVAETTADSGIVKVGQRLMDMSRALSLLSDTGDAL